MWLENENIRLRALEPEDIEILYAWENNTELWKHGSTLTPFSRLSLRQYLAEVQVQDFYQLRQLRLMIEAKNENSKLVGTLDLYEYDPHNSRAGIGILIDEPSREQGYASQTLQVAQEYAFHFLNIHQLFAYIAVDNEKSYALFQKAGYSLVGTLKQWKKEGQRFKDVYLMQLIKNERI